MGWHRSNGPLTNLKHILTIPFPDCFRRVSEELHALYHGHFARFFVASVEVPLSLRYADEMRCFQGFRTFRWPAESNFVFRVILYEVVCVLKMYLCLRHADWPPHAYTIQKCVFLIMYMHLRHAAWTRHADKIKKCVS